MNLRTIAIGMGLFLASALEASAGITIPTVAVPEPASLSLIAAGIGALAIVRARRK